MALKLSYGRKAWKLLRGLSCIYKPSDYDMDDAIEKLKINLCQDLNKMKRSTAITDYASHPLVLGPGFEPDDFDIEPIHSLAHRTSGLALISLNEAPESREKWKRWRAPSVYRVTFSRLRPFY